MKRLLSDPVRPEKPLRGSMGLPTRSCLSLAMVAALLTACGGEESAAVSGPVGTRPSDSGAPPPAPPVDNGGQAPTPTPDPSSVAAFNLQPLSVEETVPAAPLPPVWLAGDTHVHTDHSADGSAPRQGLDGRGQGNVSVLDQINAASTLSSLNWLPMTDHRTYMQHYDPLWTSNRVLLIPGEENNGSPHATTLGAVESVIQNGRTSDLPNRNAALQQSVWDAMSQNASYGLAHPDDGAVQARDGTPNQNGHVVGLDRVEMWNRGSNAETELNFCENRWNHGYRFGVVGASDDHFKELWALTPPGSPKTWVLSAGETERGILTGLHRQNTFVALNNPGPLLHFSMDRDGNGQFETLAGDEVVMPRKPLLRFRVTVSNAVGMTLNVWQAPGRITGSPAFTTRVTAAQQTIEFELPWSGATGATWYRAELREFGVPAALDTNTVRDLNIQQVLEDKRQYPDELRAVTTPIFVSTAVVEPRASDGRKLLPDDTRTPDNAVQVSRNPGRFAGFPDIARTSDGLVSVWEDHAASGTRILSRVIRNNGTADPAVVLSGSSQAARFARVVARGALVWVVWQDERSGQKPRAGGVYARYSRDGGSTWSAEILVRQRANARAELPVLVLPKDSTVPVIAWQEIHHGTVDGLAPPQDATGFDVWAVRGTGDVNAGQVRFANPKNLSINGKTYAAQNPIDTRSARYHASVRPSLAVSDTGTDIVLAYQDNRNDPDPLWTGAIFIGDSTDNDLFQIRVHTLRNGLWDAGVTLGGTDRESRHPAVTFQQGKPVVAWVSRGIGQSGSVNQTVLAADRNCSDATGKTVWCAPVVLGNTGPDGGSGYFVRMGRNAGGQAVAVWYDSRSADWRFKLGQTTLDAQRKWGEFRLLAAPGNNTWPAVSDGFMAFVSSRNAQRLQRDKTHEVFVRSVQ